MKKLPFILFCSLFMACTDLIETDLKGFGVVLLLPADNATTNSNVIVFKWEEVPHATEYHLQIVSPDFDHPVQYTVDTVVAAAQVSLALQPGSYTWRIQARNTTSSTSYYQRSLTVEAATSLADLLPLLSSPGSNAVSAAEPVVFHWQALSGADDYRFEVRANDQTGALVQAQITTATQFSVVGLTEGTYAWGVQGHNATSTSLFNYRTLYVDRTVPSVPLLLVPAASATLPNAPFTFQWQGGVDANPVSDSLFVSDANTLLIRALPMNGSSYEDSLGTGTYHWYVRTTDGAGNGSSATERTFTVQ